LNVAPGKFIEIKTHHLIIDCLKLINGTKIFNFNHLSFLKTLYFLGRKAFENEHL